MTFFEKFPSLQDLETKGEYGWDEGGGFTHSTIEECCIDKQLVSNALDMAWNRRPSHSGQEAILMNEIRCELKRMGL